MLVYRLQLIDSSVRLEFVEFLVCDNATHTALAILHITEVTRDDMEK